MNAILLYNLATDIQNPNKTKSIQTFHLIMIYSGNSSRTQSVFFYLMLVL